MHSLFGTDGIRGTVGTGLFVPEKLMTIGRAIGQWIIQKYGSSAHVLIAHDTRVSSDFVKAALKTGLLSHPLTIHDCSVLPTPALAHLMNCMPEMCCSIMISASHNPYHDNGIKVMTARGKVTFEDECIISELIQQPIPFSATATYGFDITLQNAEQHYCTELTRHFKHNFLAGKKIVLDTAHGATTHVAPTIFNYCGAHTVAINNQPDGYNINASCGALHLESLIAAVKQHNAHSGFAFDGDGDRVIAVTQHGVIKDGDDLLALLRHHPTYQTTPTIVGTVMTNEGLAQTLSAHNITLHRTAVGDKYIAEYMEQNNLLLGGEASGHIILRDIIGTGDGILVALKVLETLTLTNNWTMETFPHFPQKTINIPIKQKQQLTEAPCAHIIDKAQRELTNGRILVRYSGTENVLRVMVETQKLEQATSICQILADELAHAHSL